MKETNCPLLGVRVSLLHPFSRVRIKLAVTPSESQAIPEVLPTLFNIVLGLRKGPQWTQTIAWLLFAF